MRCEGFRVTARDRAIVRWIGRHRMVTARQVANRFGVGRSQCYARLTGLVRIGLLAHERLLHGQPGVYLATRSGLDLAGSSLPPASIDLRMYEHDLELADLVSELERDAGSAGVVLTERELRALDTPAGQSPTSYRPTYAVLLGHGTQLRLTPSGAPRVHFPDAVVVGADARPVAIELERTAKGRARLRGILRAYVAARHVPEVHYYVSDERVRGLLTDEIAQLRAGQVVKVKRRGVATVAA